MIEMKEKTDKPIKLNGIKKNFVTIPESFIWDTDSPNERIALLSYFLVKTGSDNQILFTIKDICEWMNVKLHKNRNMNTSTTRIIKLLDNYSKQNIISGFCDLQFHSIVSAYFDKDKIVDMCKSERFACIYVDEIEKIMKYDKGKNKVLTNAVLLLVFAYLRMNIFVRSMHEGLNYGAEAYNDSFKQIGIELGLSEKIVSKAANILVDLDLIRVRFRDPIMYKVGSETKFRTATNIFCNTYKRIKINGYTHLVASGESYYLDEMDQKEEKLKKMKI